jgi:hypothetical protein
MNHATLSKIYIGPLVALSGGIILELAYALHLRRKQMLPNFIGLIVLPIIVTVILVEYPSLFYFDFRL